MKRLIEEECAPGSPESQLAELVRATPPLEPAAFERVRLFERVTGAARRRRVVSARVGVAAVLIGGVAAAAAIDHEWVRSRTAPKTVGAAPSAVATVPAPPEVMAQSAVEAQTVPVATRVLSDAPSARLKAGRPIATTAFPVGEDPAPVLEAIRALRSEGDATRAGVLLAEYLKAHPRSVLSEDALALSIESAVARHDGHAASEFGRRYLVQFPNGRYRAFALRATAP